ncbi:acyltransferase family-domain-containing protein [Hyaloscypha sp. PMI_1271]|nr:acyltransferase family-domain-containing protein [Hyaloscypha sp. PMI_1271]
MEFQLLLHNDNELDEESSFPTRAGQANSMLDNFVYGLDAISRIYSACSRTLKNIASLSSTISSGHLYSLASNVLAALFNLLPRFLRKGGLNQTKTIHDTSYLDALRGWAAIIVFITHTFPYKGFPIFQHPFTKVLVHGRAMVMVFFVISGYALSYRMLKLIRTRQALALLETFISSIFRRFLRLYGSTGAATFFSMLLVWFRICIPENRQATFLLQLKHWVIDFAHFSYPLAPNVDGYVHSGALVSTYLGVTWTIPIEFRGSMLVFVFCIGACKLSTRNRMTLCWFFIVCSYFYQAIYVGMFLGGLFIADLSFTRHPDRLIPPSQLPRSSDISFIETKPSCQPVKAKIFYTAVLTVALFLLSQPHGKGIRQEYWPWPVLEKVIPSFLVGWRSRELWWISIGSFLLVWALDSCPMLQTPLLWNISQYVGELSFGIYLTHLLVLWTVWTPILDPLRVLCLGDAMWTYAPFYAIHFLVMIWASELFIRFDKKVIAFAAWCKKKTFVW